MPKSINVFQMGTQWCIQIDDHRSLLSAKSEIEAKEFAESLILWQPEGMPRDPFIHVHWERAEDGHFHAVITEG